MSDDKLEPTQATQKTRPRKKGAKPVDIPIPTRKEVFDLMRGVVGKRPSVPDDRRPKQ